MKLLMEGGEKKSSNSDSAGLFKGGQAHPNPSEALSHDPSSTVGTCTTRTGGHTAPHQPTNFPRRELTVAALVVTERQNTPKITLFTAVSRPFYNV